MHLIKLLMMMISFFVANALTGEPDENLWAKSMVTELTKNCEKLKQKEWVERYQAKSIEVMNKLKDLGAEKYEALDADEPLRQMVSGLFSQHTPQGKRKAPPNLCFAYLKDYMKAKNNTQSMPAMKRFDSCNEDRYKGEIPDAVADTLSCMKKIRY